jgi:hypothetical protein
MSEEQDVFKMQFKCWPGFCMYCIKEAASLGAQVSASGKGATQCKIGLKTTLHGAASLECSRWIEDTSNLVYWLV